MPSSVVRAYTYDEKEHRLDVLFVSGLRYVYTHVPREVADGLRSATSKGTYFNAHIRDHFAYERKRTTN